MKKNVLRRFIFFVIAAVLTVVLLLIARETSLAAYPQAAGLIPGSLLIVASLLVRKMPKSASPIPFFFLPLLFGFVGPLFLILFSIGLHFLISVVIAAGLAALVSLLIAAAYQHHLDLWHPGLGLAAFLGALSIIIPGLGIWMLEFLPDVNIGTTGLIIIAAFWVLGTGISFSLESRDDILQDSYFDKLIKTFGRNE